MRYLALFFTLTCWLSANAQLQDDQAAADNDAAAELDNITVTSARSLQDIKSVPAKITIIDRQTLRQQQLTTVNLFDLLAKLVPSFSPGRQKLTGAGESFRGRSPLFLIDGVPQTNPLRDGSRDGVTIDLDVIERIEIIHGPNAIQGLGATGGVINLITVAADPSGVLKQHAQISLSSSDHFDSDGFGVEGDYRASKSFGAFDIVGAVSYASRELLFDGDDNPVGIDNTQGDIADSDAYNLFLKTGWNIDADQRLQFTANDFRISGDGDYESVDGDRMLGIPTTSVRGNPPGTPAENDVTTLTLDYAHRNVLGGQLNLQAYYQDFEAIFGGGIFDTFQDPDIAPPGTLFEQSANVSQKVGTRLTYAKNAIFNTPVNIVTGFDFVRDQTEQRLVQTNRSWVPETRFFDYAPFLQTEYEPVKWLNLSAGIRYEIAELKVADFSPVAGNTAPEFNRFTVTGGSPGFDEALLNGGFVIDPVDWLSIYGTYSEGFSMPDVGRVLRGISEPGTQIDKFLQLNPIISDNLESGVRINRGPFSFQFSYFDSDSGEGSRLVPNDDGIFLVRRQRTSVEGFELSGQYAFSNSVVIGANYSNLNGRFDNDGDDIVDSDLSAVDISPDRLNVYLDARPFGAQHWLGVNLQLSTLMDRSFEDSSGAVTGNFDGYTTIDMQLRAQLDPYNISLGVENLLDNTYITYFGQAGTTRSDRFFAGNGRRFTLRLSADF